MIPEKKSSRLRLTRCETIAAGVLAGFILVSSVQTAMGQEMPDFYTVDTSHSSVHLSVDHLGLTRVRGAFTDWAGVIAFDSTQVDRYPYAS